MKSVKIKLNFEKFKSKNQSNSDFYFQRLGDAIGYIKEFKEFRNTSVNFYAGATIFTSLDTRQIAQVNYDSNANIYFVKFYDRENNEISSEVLERNF